MKTYLSRILEYSKLIKEIEIAGEEHLKIISKNREHYLKGVEDLKTRIASDNFLTKEDKERMLKKISEYVEIFEKKEDGLDFNSFLLGILITYLAKEGIISEIIESFKDFFE
ncbi:MAG: hypothetical protein QW228_00280 [Candidatus Aenigmatarchaeota archaeon]